MNRLDRRDWLKGIGGAAAGVVVLRGGAGCGYFPAERGPAYAPWSFPSSGSPPEMVAAEAAILASNPHNTQPWLLHVTSTAIDLHADLARNTGSVDGLMRELHIGLGCALENLVIAAKSSGRSADVVLLPDPATPTLVASVTLAVIELPPVADPLFLAIPTRHTNRGRYASASAATALPAAVAALVTEPGVELTLLVAEADMATFRSGTNEATVAFIADPEMSHDSNLWYRHTADEILQHRDGITLDASGNGAATRFFGKSRGRPSDATSNSYWLDATRGIQATASAYGILSSPSSNGRDDQLRVGRAYQRIALWAISQGMAVQPLNQMAEMQDREETKGLDPRFTGVLGGLVGQSGRRAQMLFRIGYPWDVALESPRRPLAWVRL